MNKGLIRLAVAGMMIAGVCAAVAEEAAKPAAAKPAAAAKTEWKGALSAPAAGADASVVAVLMVKKPAEKYYNLTSTDAAVTTTLKDLAAKGAKVDVKGELSKDEASIAVSKCVELKKGEGKPAAAK